MAIWTLVMNGTSARIFRSDTHGDFEEVESFVNPANRVREGELHDDSRGHATSGKAGPAESFDESSAHDVARERFAADVACHLADALEKGAYHGLYLVCSPAMMGTMRDRLSASVKGAVRGEVTKNLAGHPSDDIRAHLPDRL